MLLLGVRLHSIANSPFRVGEADIRNMHYAVTLVGSLAVESDATIFT